MPDGPRVFDFVNPLQLKVETPATGFYPPLQAEADHSAGEGTAAEVSIVDIAAELERLMEGSSGSKPDETAAGPSSKLKRE
jgi:hypothetical protein